MARLTADGTGTLTFEAGSGKLDIATLVANTSLTLNTDATFSAVTFGEGKTISLGEGKTLTASGAFLTPFLGDGVVNPTELPLSGGTLALDLGAGKTLKMNGSGEGATLGNLTITSGTLEFNAGGEKGPGYGRTITVTGTDSVLKFSAQDATGWTENGNKVVLANGAKLIVNHRDTFASSLELAGGTIELQNNAQMNTANGVDDGRAFDWHEHTNDPLKVTANSTITYAADAVGNARCFGLRDGTPTFEVRRM